MAEFRAGAIDVAASEISARGLSKRPDAHTPMPAPMTTTKAAPATRMTPSEPRVSSTSDSGTTSK